MRYGCVLFACVAILSACGGGGGGGGTTNPATATPQQTPTTGPLITNASGKVVDDTTGNPLSGMQVVLEPWTAGATPLPLPQATTDANGNFTLSAAPNGHYLLVIGSNSATDTTRATVHDNITLTGGNQTLQAPKLPAMPGYTAPAWETNGTYRLATISTTSELPCFQRFNADRTTAAQAQVPLDEWTIENVRTNNANAISSHPIAPLYVSSQNGFESSGTFDCNGMVDYQFSHGSPPYGPDARVAWVGAAMIFGTTSYVGVIEAPFDPRGYSDPNYPTWP